VPLGFLAPLFLAGIAAVAIPVALHLMRRHADPVVPFGAMRLINRTPVEQVRRRRLRELLLLALRCAALTLLALSFARPYFVSAQAQGSAPLTVVAVDTSYSLSTRAQIERARQLARAAVDEAPSGGPVALVTFDDKPTVAVPPTLDRAAVRSAVSGIVPRARGTRYAAALSAAGDLFGNRGGRLVIVTDLQPHGWDGASQATLPSGVAVDVREVPGPAGNLALRNVERSATGIVARIASTWSEPRPARVTLRIDGRAPIEAASTIPPHQLIDVPLTVALPAAGSLHVSVTDPDGFAADNDYYVVLDAPARPRVLLVTGEGAVSAAFYVTKAIQATETQSGFAVDQTTADQVDDRADLSSYAAVVVLGSGGLDRRGADALADASSRGTGLVVVAGPTIDAARFTSLLPPSLAITIGPKSAPEVPLSLATTDGRHPVFAAFGSEPGLLGSVRFVQFARVPEESASVLARFSNGSPALLELRHQGGRVLVLASDMANGWNDLALHPVFVPLVHGLLDYVADKSATAASYHVGDWPGTTGDAPGVIEVAAPGPSGTRRIAVNVDTRESDDGRMSAAAFRSALPHATPGSGAMTARAAADGRAAEHEQSLWRYGLMVMLAALAAESVVGRRS
jgi:hypothetical protein